MKNEDTVTRIGENVRKNQKKRIELVWAYNEKRMSVDECNKKALRK